MMTVADDVVNPASSAGISESNMFVHAFGGFLSAKKREKPTTTCDFSQIVASVVQHQDVTNCAAGGTRSTMKNCCFCKMSALWGFISDPINSTHN